MPEKEMAVMFRGNLDMSVRRVSLAEGYSGSSEQELRTQRAFSITAHRAGRARIVHSNLLQSSLQLLEKRGLTTLSLPMVITA